MISLEQYTCADMSTTLSREWMETNGIGGYASASVCGANTRRYHGLLVAATRPPLGRVVMLSKYEETIVLDGKRFELSTNQYPGNIHPDGYKYLTGFRLDPFPIWSFQVNGLMIERSIFMVNGENTTVCEWSIVGDAGGEVLLEIRPLLAFRDHHHLRGENDIFNKEYEIGDQRLSVRPYIELPQLNFTHNASAVEQTGYWYKNFEYSIERERGFDHHEDLFQPFSLTFDLAASARIIATIETHAADEVPRLRMTEIARRNALVERSMVDDEISKSLVLAADQFIVDRGEGKTVIAGYHWFSDWGRDTMIALPGLTLATNRPEISKSIIVEFSKHISEGMLPNRFPDAGETPEYNTVDATLWYFDAIRAYVDMTGDLDLVRHHIYEKLSEIIDSHIRGTRYGIVVDSDGLLKAGEPGIQLTWMDAKIGDWVVTPRTGKAVEIQALWYNALCVMSNFANALEDKTGQKKFRSMAAKAKSSFRAKFWDPENECLYDVITDDHKDSSLRPNQIFAVSLPFSMIDAATSKKVVAKVESELLTPFGLRSLSSSDPSYVPTYIGSPYDRDSSYHQGTVWGWLIGPFVDAYLKTHSKNAKTRERVDEIMRGFAFHLTDAMIGQVSEIFDADAPHLSRGCAAQAWSVAELLRVRTLTQ